MSPSLLGDEALEAAPLAGLPGERAPCFEPAYRPHDVRPIDGFSRILRRCASGGGRRTSWQLICGTSNTMKIGGRADDGWVRFAEQLESRDELLIEYRDLAIDHERVGPQLRDRGREFEEAMGVVDRIAGDQPGA